MYIINYITPFALVYMIFAKFLLKIACMQNIEIRMNSVSYDMLYFSRHIMSHYTILIDKRHLSRIDENKSKN